MKKSVIRICCFLILLACILGYCNSVFKPKYSSGISNVTSFYELEDNTVDVLVLGSSHAFVNFSTSAFWSEYGISSYNLGGSSQPFWNSYYDLKEALKTQTPELIILEAYSAVFDFEYSDDSSKVLNTYGLKWSQNKIDAIKASAEKDRAKEFLLDYSRYHTRYSELDRADFFDDYGSQKDCNWFGLDWKGQYLFNTSMHNDIMDVSAVDYETPMTPKVEEYYRKIIELAQDNNIPIVIAVAPYTLYECEQSIYLSAQRIASEYGVEFINYNLLLDEIGFDYDSDFHDSCHMTAIGAYKFTKYVGEHLKETYTISDHRGDPGYSTWDRWTYYSDQFEKGERLIETYDKEELASKLCDENYYVFVSVDGTCDPFREENVRFLNSLGIHDENPYGIWVMQNGKELYSSGSEDFEQYIRTARRDFCVRHNGEPNTNELIIDNVSYGKKVENGINVTVYDNVTNMIVDEFGINSDDNCNVVR